MAEPETKPTTTQGYFALLAERAAYAAAQGNYAIAAALVVRDGSGQAIFEGWNTLFADRDPAGHAEMNAILLAAAVARLPEPSPLVDRALRANAIHASAADAPAERILYTTLEPCPMCTVGLINAGIDHVIVAAEDPPSGTLETARLRRLPRIWADLAQASNLQVSFCQSEDPSVVLTYIPSNLRERLLRQFSDSRDRLDDQLGRNGVLDPAPIVANALGLHPHGGGI